jgi:hypothetical protein
MNSIGSLTIRRSIFVLEFPLLSRVPIRKTQKSLIRLRDLIDWSRFYQLNVATNVLNLRDLLNLRSPSIMLFNLLHNMLNINWLSALQQILYNCLFVCVASKFQNFPNFVESLLSEKIIVLFWNNAKNFDYVLGFVHQLTYLNIVLPNYRNGIVFLVNCANYVLKIFQLESLQYVGRWPPMLVSPSAVLK